MAGHEEAGGVLRNTWQKMNEWGDEFERRHFDGNFVHSVVGAPNTAMQAMNEWGLHLRIAFTALIPKSAVESRISPISLSNFPKYWQPTQRLSQGRDIHESNEFFNLKHSFHFFVSLLQSFGDWKYTQPKSSFCFHSVRLRSQWLAASSALAMNARQRIQIVICVKSLRKPSPRARQR
eukprot:symbB.v1.2.025652.t1/scaffold2504.1/size77551/9